MCKNNIRAIFQVLVILFLAFTFQTPADAGVFYKFDVIAKTGQAGLVGMGDNPSINDKGTVAFVGQLAGGEGVFIGDGQPARRT